jgi:two-component system cell cycle response regulator
MVRQTGQQVGKHPALQRRPADDRTGVETVQVATLPEHRVRVQSTGRRAVLVYLDGADRGMLVPLDSPEVVLGRDGDCRVLLRDDGVSRRHARIRAEGPERWMQEDLGSKNGTWVNAVRIDKRLLADGDRLTLGRAVLKFLLQDAEEETYQRQLYEISTRDALTNLLNRRSFNDRLAVEIAYARRHGSLLAALMIDLDHFKLVNDTHGHLAGDRVLAAVAAFVLGQVRIEDIAARYGGEEFIIVLRDIPSSGVLTLAERIRRGVEQLVIEHEGAKLPVTVSIGLAARQGSSTLTAEELIAAADREMYRAKSAGRNRVVAEAPAGT